MEADKVTKMDAKMVIKSIFREQNVQLELVAGGCADDNVSSKLVGEVVDVVGMVADRQVVEEELDMVEEQVTKVDTMYKDRDREQNLGSKLLSVMIILFLEVVREVIGVFQQVMDMQVNKMKDQEVHKLKDKVSREVAKMYKDFEHTIRADDWGKNVFSKVIGEMIHVVQVVMNMQMDKVEDYKVFKEEEQVTREVPKVDKDMIRSRFWENVG